MSWWTGARESRFSASWSQHSVACARIYMCLVCWGLEMSSSMRWGRLSSWCSPETARTTEKWRFCRSIGLQSNDNEPYWVKKDFNHQIGF